MEDGAAFFKSLKELTPTLGHHVVTLKATTRFSPSIIRELTSLRHLHIRLGAPATFTPFCKALAHLKPSIKTLYIDEAALVELGTTAGLTAEQGVLFGEAIATFLPLTDVTLGSIRDLPFLMQILHALGGLPGVRKVALRYCRSLRGSQAPIPPSNADGSIRFPQLESFVHSNGSSTWTTLSAQLFQEGMAGPKLRSMDLENVYSVAGPPAAAVSKRRLRNLTRLALERVRVTMSILEECRGGALKELTVGTTGTRDEDLRSLVPLVNLTHDLPHLTQLDLHLPHPRSAAFLRHIASNAVTAGTLARLEAQAEQLKAIMESRGGEMRLHRTGMSTIVPEDDETISDFEEPPAAVNESMDEVAT